MIPPLLWASYRRYLTKHLWLPLLCLCAISTGVAVILGTDLASVSARASFAQSTQALTGRATHALVGVNRTVPDSEFRRLRVEERVRSSAPVVEGYVSVATEGDSGQTLTLLGVDPFVDGAIREWTGARGGEVGPSSDGVGATGLVGSAHSVVASAAVAQRLQWKVGQSKAASVGGRKLSLELAGTFSPEGQAAGALDGYLLADISTAQSLLGQDGLDRIDLVLSDAQADKLANSLPLDLVLTEAATSQRTASELSAAFHTSLQALSYLCMLVASFLIFNVVSFSVVHRRQSMGRLRILGVTGAQLRRLIFSEALLLGSLGSALGLPLGALLGQGLVPLVSRTINDLYYQHSITGFSLPPHLLIKAALCGIAASGMAALFPAYLVGRTEPLALMRQAQTVESGRRLSLKLALAGFLLLALSVLILAHDSLTAGFLSLLGVLLGYSLCVPLGLWVATWLARRLSSRVTHRMATVGIAVHLPRTATAAVALTVAVAATISISVMVDSFRQTLTLWLANTLQADVYVSCRDRAASSRGQAHLPQVAFSEAIRLSGVRDWSAQRMVTVPSESGETVLLGLRSASQSRSSFRFLDQVEDGWSRFEAGEGVFLTEPYARRAKKKVGQTLSFSTPKGRSELPVLGIYYSYAPDRNTALLSDSAFRQMFGTADFSGLGLYLERGADVARTVSQLKQRFGESVEVRATSEIKAMALEIFERTFTITAVLRYLALGIATVGMVLSLWALGEERTREVQVLRALGMTGRELFAVSCSQSYWMGLAAGVLACPLGAILAKMMISVLNRRAFGWTIDFAPNPSALWTALALSLGTAFLAGLIPAYRWSRWSVEEGLRERE